MCTVTEVEFNDVLKIGFIKAENLILPHLSDGSLMSL